MKKQRIIIASLLILLCFSAIDVKSFSLWPDKGKKQLVYSDNQKAQTLVKTLNATEVLGPLAPVALSPFFGMACLSATSMLVNHGILPENEFLMGNTALDNGMVFVAFALLTILTSVPKLTTASKALAELTDQAETYAGVISYLVIFSLTKFGSQLGSEQVVYAAGIFTFTKQTILMAAAVMNIIVINTVKFFFELLAFISPVPFLDAMFEAANKTFAAFLAVVYAFNPYLALLLNILLFLICLSIFNLCRRRMKYLKAILLEPLLHSLLKQLFARDRDADKKAKHRIKNIFGTSDNLMKVFPLKKLGRIKKKELCYFIKADGQYKIIKFRLLREPKIETVNSDNITIEKQNGILSNTMILKDASEKTLASFAFSKVYDV